jgi:mRNA-degrading endonuclease toxin of MazEF toxin-antitoxin module
VILADHLKSVDWNQRRAQKIAPISSELIGEVLDRLAPLLGF